MPRVTASAAISIHRQMSRAMSASSARTSTIAGLKRRSRSGSSSARTRLRGMRRVAVRLILHKRHAPLGEVGLQRAPPASQERADQRAAPGVHRRETTRAGAAQQTQEERFRLIVARVSQRDGIGRKVRARPLEKRVPRRARRVLDRPPLAPRTRRHIFAFRKQRPAERRRLAADETLLGVGRRTKSMIEMRDAGHLQLARRGELAQQVRERHRIGSARQRHDDARCRTGQIVVANRLPDEIEQRHIL